MPYFLRHGIPEEGTPKPGGPGPHQVNARLRDIGRSVGIDFTGLCPRFPNTLKAHCLLTYALEAQGVEMQNKVQEIVFRQYFTDGLYPDLKNLVQAAEEAGLPADDTRRVLEEGRYEEQVRKQVEESSRQVRTGVPAFFINGKFAFSGAQPPDMLLQELRRA